MPIIIDSERGKKVATLLYNSFFTNGIHGRTEMPEDTVPDSVRRGSLEHLLFITLTVSIDYQRDAPALWESSRRSFEDPGTRYLFGPKSLYESSLDQIVKDMQKHKLSKKPHRDAIIWRTVGGTFHQKWKGDPREFVKSCNWDSLRVFKKLNDSASDFPYLRGQKIGPLWLRMLRDNVGLEQLRNLDKIPIPVDIHVARATLAVGVVRGQARISFASLFEDIRRAWFESVEDLRVMGRPMIALDVDEPLWHLSKYGCTNRDKITGYCPAHRNCEAREYCVNGRINIANNVVELDT